MRIANRVRRIYEHRPYPPPSLRAAVARSPMPSLDWINAVLERPAPLSPRRILVAGCGVGIEAFALAKRFPDAQVVGVDFSERSIAAANRLRRTSDVRVRVRFVVADIARRDLPDIAGDRFDLISCHGVLSYVPETVSVLRNFVRCLTPAGVVILGVNGASHPSVRFRRVLSGFGIEIDEFREDDRVREILRVCDSLSFYPPAPLAEKDAGYLAGDVFGPLNRALTLSEWKAFCAEAGLHLRGSYHAFFAVRTLLNRDLHAAVMPRSRAELAELADVLFPASFHQMVLSRRAPIKTPWNDATELLRRRPIRTPLYKIRWPRGGGPWHNLRSVKLKSQSTQTGVSLRVPQWEVEILRKGDGHRSLREILDPVRPSVSAKSLREAMYLLYQLGAVNFLPERS